MAITSPPCCSCSRSAASTPPSSPGSRTNETPVRTSRYVVGSSLLTVVFGSGICFTQTHIFTLLSNHQQTPAQRGLVRIDDASFQHWQKLERMTRHAVSEVYPLQRYLSTLL